MRACDVAAGVGCNQLGAPSVRAPCGVGGTTVPGGVGVAGASGSKVVGTKDSAQGAGQGQGVSTPRARDGELVARAHGCLPYVQHVWA